MLPSQEFFGIRNGKGVSRGFSPRSCAQSLHTPTSLPRPGSGQWNRTQRGRLQAGAGRNGTEKSSQAQVPAQAGFPGRSSHRRSPQAGGLAVSSAAQNTDYLPAHPSPHKDDQMMRLKQADSPGHGDKPKCWFLPLEHGPKHPGPDYISLPSVPFFMAPALRAWLRDGRGSGDYRWMVVGHLFPSQPGCRRRHRGVGSTGAEEATPGLGFESRHCCIPGHVN